MKLALWVLILCAAVRAQDAVAFVIEGRVVDRPGVEVSVWDDFSPDRFLARTVTDEAGHFAVAVEREDALRREHPYGPVVLVVRGKGVAQTRRRTGVGAGEVEIVAADAKPIVAFVLDAKGDPLPGTVVRAEQIEETTTGEDGRFVLTQFAVDEVHVVVLRDGFRLGGRIRNGAKFVVPDVPLAKARIVDAATGKPVVGAQLLQGGQLPFFATTPFVAAMSDKDGGVEAPAGRYDVHAPGYATTGLALGEEQTLRLAAVPPLSGSVVDEDGRPLHDCHVTIGRLHSTWTDDVGRFQFRIVPRAMVNLTARRRGYLPATVRVEAGRAADRWTLRLGRGTRTSGRVTRDGEPALGARAVFIDQGGAVVAQSFCDPDGIFHLFGLPPTARQVFAAGPGRRSRLHEPDETLHLALKTHLPLSGVLHSDAGQPLSGVGIQCGEHTAYTDASGHFVIEKLPVAEYVVRAAPLDHAHVVAKAWAGAQLELVAKSRYGDRTLRVDVAVEGARRVLVAIRRQEEPRVRRTSADGRFESLPAGNYDVIARAEGYLDEHATVFVAREGEPPHLSLTPARGGTLRFSATKGAKVLVQTLKGKPAPVSLIELGSETEELGGFGPGRYRFIARARGELIVIREIELGPQTPPVSVDLRGGGKSTLVVTVRDAAGDAVPEAGITLVAEGGFSWDTRRRTDADGKVLLKRLFQGRMEVRAKAGEREAAVVVFVEPKMSLTAEVRLP